MTKIQAYEMPTYEEFLHGVERTLYECPQFKIIGILYPGNRLHIHAKWDGDHMTPGLFKMALNAVEYIKDGAFKAGLDAIYTVVPEHLLKWESMLGFRILEEWTNNADPHENLFLLKQPTGAL